jgi:hypothetical protein
LGRVPTAFRAGDEGRGLELQKISSGLMFALQMSLHQPANFIEVDLGRLRYQRVLFGLTQLLPKGKNLALAGAFIRLSDECGFGLGYSGGIHEANERVKF